MIKLHTVRSKIVFLLLVGLIGILSNAGVNRYTQNIKNAYFDLTRDSQEIKLQVFDSLRLEQQFINRRNAEVLDRLQKSENQLQASIDMLKGRLEKFCEDVSKELPACPFITDEIIVKIGNPVDIILDELETTHCDVVVMGAHGHGVIGEAVLGSVSRRVLRRCKKPVLVVRLPEGKAG